STSSQALDSFAKSATGPTTTVFSTLRPSLGRVLYQWYSHTFPCFLRSSFVNQPLCDISAFHPDSAGNCLGLNHTGFLPRSKPRFFRRRHGGSEFAQAKTPDTSRAIADVSRASPCQGIRRPNGFVLLWRSAVRGGYRHAAIPWGKLGSHLQSHC